MTNNDILKRLRFTFDYNDAQMVAIFKLADYEVEVEEMTAWLRKDNHPDYLELIDKDLAIFLNGLINEKRGKREGPQPTPEKTIDIVVKNGHLEKSLLLTSVQGQTINLPAKGNKNTYIWFNSPWCEWYLADSKPAISEACTALRKVASSRDDLAHWVAVSLDVWANESDVTGYLEQHQLKIPTVLDNTKAIFKSFGIRSLPSLVVLKPDGTVVQTKTFASAKDVKAFFSRNKD